MTMASNKMIFCVIVVFLSAMPSIQALYETNMKILSLDERPGLGANTTNQTLAKDMKPVPLILYSEEAYAGLKELAEERRNLTKQHLSKRDIDLPAVVNWRNRWGVNWVTTVQSQGRCMSCWAFAAAALLETQARIEHGYWAKRSEGDIRDGMLSGHEPGRFIPDTQYCGQSATFSHALDFERESGAADLDCFAYSTALSDPYKPCKDRSGRTVKVGAYTDISEFTEKKKWLYLNGPLVMTFIFVNALYSYTATSGVFHAPTTGPGSNVVGQHNLLVVGYDDNQQAWIVKNSFDTIWGDNGFALLGYGEMSMDKWGMQGLKYTNPDPWVKRRSHNGNMIHSGNGRNHKNFEAVLCGRDGIYLRFRTGGEGGIFRWFEGGTIATFPATRPSQCNGQPAFTGTTYNRNFEFLYWSIDNNIRHVYFEQSRQRWFGGGSFGNGQISGYPGFIQGNYEAPGNFEAVVRHSDGSLNHWWRPEKSRTWNYGGLVCASGVKMSGASLVQANVGKRGHFYVLAVMDDTSLKFFWRNNDVQPLQWLPGESFGALVGATSPNMIQRTWGTHDETSIGNFEVLVAAFGNAVHYRRDNSDLRAGGTPKDGNGADRWTQVDSFGAPHVKHVWSFIEGPFYMNLEAVVELFDGTMQHWFYESGKWTASVGGVLPPAA